MGIIVFLVDVILQKGKRPISRTRRVDVASDAVPGRERTEVKHWNSDCLKVASP